MSSIGLSSSALSVILACDSKLHLSNDIITCRASDGYVNLTELCKAGGKLFAAWKQNRKTLAFLSALENDIRILIPSLIVFQKGISLLAINNIYSNIKANRKK